MTKLRARERGIQIDGQTGRFNAISDVAGVHVGFKTLIEETPRTGRKMPVRTGVTAIIPHASHPAPVPMFAGIHRFNGNGEMTGSHWIEDGGYFIGPVVITNTHAVGIAHHATVKWLLSRYPATYQGDDHEWILPVVAETFDGMLNDINGQPLTASDVIAALDDAKPGPVAEGNTGGGTGMICYGFKGGTGTASRVLDIAGNTFTLGVLVQANHGQRDWLTISGIPVGRELGEGTLEEPKRERGSIIVVIATDLPILPHQLKRVARRASIGIGRGGTPGGNSSGDIFLAFSTAHVRPMPHRAPPRFAVDMINDEVFDPIYLAVVEAVEEAVLNAMFAAGTLGGTAHDRYLVHALPVDQVLAILRRYGRLEG